VRGLNHQLKKLCQHNREGSYGTQVRRERELTLIANQLYEIGYRGMNDHSLRPKHVEGLVRHWLENEVAAGTIKFIPSYADQGDRLTLKPSWTKGGKARTIPIRTPEQREVLDRAHKLAGSRPRQVGHRASHLLRNREIGIAR